MCRHCCFGSNPSLTQRVGLDDILRFIDEGSSQPSLKVVVFSGGECFLLGDDLVKAVAYATSKGLITRCVTNGYWAKSLRLGQIRLEELKDAGLCELNVSTGDYHQAWVSQDSVINAACLGVNLGLNKTIVVVEVQKSRTVTAAALATDRRVVDLLSQSPEHFSIIESPWMPMDSGAVIDQHEVLLLNRRNVHLREGCKSILNTVVLTPSRGIGFCCGLSRELVPELNAQWEPGALAALLEQGAQDFIKIWLSVDGPERILAWAASKNPRIDWENRYAHHCHACLTLFDDPLVRSAIAEHYQERVDDVLVRYSFMLRTREMADGAVYG
jgi:hypothetical protein